MVEWFDATQHWIMTHWLASIVIAVATLLILYNRGLLILLLIWGWVELRWRIALWSTSREWRDNIQVGEHVAWRNWAGFHSAKVINIEYYTDSSWKEKAKNDHVTVKSGCASFALPRAILVPSKSIAGIQTLIEGLKR